MSLNILSESTDQEIMQNLNIYSWDVILLEAYYAGREELMVFILNAMIEHNILVHKHGLPLPLIQRIYRDFPLAIEIESDEQAYITEDPNLDIEDQNILPILLRCEFFGLDRFAILNRMIESVRHSRPEDLHSAILSFIHPSTRVEDLDYFIRMIKQHRNFNVDASFETILYQYHRLDLMAVIHAHFHFGQHTSSHNIIMDLNFPLNAVYKFDGRIKDIRVTNLKMVNRLLSANWSVAFPDPRPRLREIQHELRKLPTYVMALMISDEYYQLKETNENERARSFFGIIAKLPITFQLKIIGAESFSSEAINSELKTPFYWLD